MTNAEQPTRRAAEQQPCQGKTGPPFAVPTLQTQALSPSGLGQNQGKNQLNRCNSGAVLPPFPAGAPWVPSAVVVPVKLNRGFYAWVSAEDFERVAPFRWSVSVSSKGPRYAFRHVPGSGKRGPRESMHRFLTGAQPGQRIGHWNGDGLHNWRENLRLCTPAEGVRKAKPWEKKVTSQYKGVSFCKAVGKFRAQIMCRGKKINLGNYPDEETAARVYDENARKLFGDFARPNFPPIPARSPTGSAPTLQPND